MVDFDLIKKLIKLVEDADITGLAVEEKGMKVEVRREKGVASPVIHMPAPVAREPHPAKEASAQAAEEEGMTAITSPMVGTFYRSPSPESPAYVEVGDKVAPGKVVCIIEAMKLFNEIESEISGTVAKVLVENGQPVEYGQKLMLIKKG
jgi:acetyl-CoA carboxylase biotin carboxyl carrier protein